MSQAAIKPDLENNSKDGWPSTVDLKVILPGLCYYEDLKNAQGEITGGTVLIRKEAFDRMAPSIKGKPILNWDHRKVKPGEFSKGSFQGVITSEAKFNAVDGWYHAEGLVWDKGTLNNIERGFSISCAYMPTEVDTTPGRHNMVPYQAEVLNGEYTHVAVVSVPRYEGARIELLNSIKGGVMGILSLFRKDKPEEKIDIDMAAKINLEGVGEVSLSEMANSWKKQQALAGGFKDEDTIEVDGKKATVLELKNAHLKALENAMKDDHDSGKHKDSPKDNCGYCNSAAEEKEKKEKDEKDDKERKNAAAAAEKKSKVEEEVRNAAAVVEAKAKEDAAKAAAELEEKRNAGKKIEMPAPVTLKELMNEGERRYGPLSASAAK